MNSKLSSRLKSLYKGSPKISLKLTKASKGLKIHQPELCMEGVNGTYFMKTDEGVNIGVFKPQDEEGSFLNKPKSAGHILQPINAAASPSQTKKPSSTRVNGVNKGEAALREVAAYLVDREHFYGVPSTTMVKLAYAANPEEVVSSRNSLKIGSFQEFVESDGSLEDIGVNSFPVREVHKIGILDLHIFNTDRHEGNVLYRETDDGTCVLTPIDHGLSLPHSMENVYFGWISWPQAKVPFDEETKAYIHRIDVDRDIQMLKSQLNITDDCLRIMKVSSTLLKKGAANNLTLQEIGKIASRYCFDKPSELEVMYQQAGEQAKLASQQPQGASKHEEEDELFYEIIFRLMDEKIQTVASRSASKVSK